MRRCQKRTCGGVTIAYDVFGPATGEPVVLVCGLSQPAVGWHFAMVPALTEAGYRVVTFDNRGVAPSSAPPAPYTIDEMVDDTVGLLDHLGLDAVHIAGYSMGGWMAETLAHRHPERVRSRGVHRELQRRDLVGEGHHHRRARPGPARQRAAPVVQRRRDHAVPAQPRAAARRRRRPVAGAHRRPRARGRIPGDWASTRPPWRGLSTSSGPAVARDLTRPCLVLAFEHDVDSPPARARQAAGQIPGARFVEVPGASHLGVFTHADAVSERGPGILRRRRRHRRRARLVGAGAGPGRERYPRGGPTSATRFLYACSPIEVHMSTAGGGMWASIWSRWA